ncbi:MULTISPECIES: hypothetical protein [Micrococcaceae]|uniref:hypothetical protein n=1 Tax=Micrococcaceae TaxID=1268 RepID=UPI001177E75E|nr:MULTISPECIES: hypothetical protein [Micrococcaceae]
MSKKRLEISWIGSVGSALGAVTSAVVLSTLGVAGTILGAALGSLVITVGGSIYSQSLQRTTEHVGERVGNARAKTRPFNDAQPPATPRDAGPSGTTVDEVEKPAKNAGRGILQRLPWKHIIGVTVALFAITMALILAFELSAGRAVSSFTGGTSGTGGTSIPGISGNTNPTDDSGTKDQDPNSPVQDEAPDEEQQPQQDQAPAPQEEEPAAPEAPQEPAPAPAPAPDQPVEP